jgi:hypothetical protein
MSPRTEIFADAEVLLMEINGALCMLRSPNYGPCCLRHNVQPWILLPNHESCCPTMDSAAQPWIQSKSLLVLFKHSFCHRCACGRASSNGSILILTHTFRTKSNTEGTKWKLFHGEGGPDGAVGDGGGGGGGFGQGSRSKDSSRSWRAVMDMQTGRSKLIYDAPPSAASKPPSAAIDTDAGTADTATITSDLNLDLNCSKVQRGVALRKVPPLVKFVGITDNGECCAKCKVCVFRQKLTFEDAI